MTGSAVAPAETTCWAGASSSSASETMKPPASVTAAFFSFSSEFFVSVDSEGLSSVASASAVGSTSSVDSRSASDFFFVVVSSLGSVDFFAAVVFFAVAVFFAAVFFAGAFFVASVVAESVSSAGAFSAAFLAVVLFAVVDFAVVFFSVVDFFAAVVFARVVVDVFVAFFPFAAVVVEPPVDAVADVASDSSVTVFLSTVGTCTPFASVHTSRLHQDTTKTLVKRAQSSCPRGRSQNCPTMQ
ncbi:Uncharacterised protein [Mycobacteroides abscessus subsp. abscessus]|nr:Uncharacterised protein [Mycobacteroides abscessus subsp. abscessus]